MGLGQKAFVVRAMLKVLDCKLILMGVMTHAGCFCTLIPFGVGPTDPVDWKSLNHKKRRKIAPKRRFWGLFLLISGRRLAFLLWIGIHEADDERTNDAHRAGAG
jgi:hypothetical protein